ncbi:MAG: UDP-N-acetylmuramate dehydrogenase [Proteobacteria bacterium]|nr:UDP-N-acetylmuramate dehydrogenase [Pseudomonadota bacterium]MBU1686320.1 UDP-N-acetylmuramate dehydrogenase [Pseudomonadota bacterium]
MADYCTLKVGGEAWAVLAPTDSDSIVRITNGLSAEGFAWRVIGQGSNLLVPDEGYHGAILVMGSGYGAIRMVNEAGEAVRLEVEAGCRLGRLLNWSLEKGLAGLEFVVGIPGTLGGAVVMNAGAIGREMKDVIDLVTILDGAGEVHTRTQDQLSFTYRSWGEPPESILLSARLVLDQGDGDQLRETCRELMRARRGRQPWGMANAGSIFKNPPGGYAGKLIETTGLKGLQVGGAMVSEEHANVIVNTGKATATDVITLMHEVRDQVLTRHGISLEPEIHMLTVRPWE